MRRLTRRESMVGLAAASGLGFLGAHRAVRAAMVQGKPSTLLLVMMNGGYAPIQTSAASFINNTPAQMSFGCTAANITVHDELSYDRGTFGLLPKKALDRLGAIGSEGASNHNSAKHFWEGPQGGLPQALAAAMGGAAAIKAARVGEVTGAPGGSVAGVSLEPVNNMSSALETLTGKGQVIAAADRPIMGQVMQATMDRFAGVAQQNPNNLAPLTDGYRNLIKSMTTPAVEVEQTEIQAAYGAIKDHGLAGKLGICEALMRSGVNVVCVGEGEGTYWDTHDDNDGRRTREYFGKMVPGLSLFCTRMLGRDDLNVSIVFVSEHSRIPLISNHGPHISTIVISDNVIGGKSTGVTDNGGLLPDADKKKVIHWKAAIGELVGLQGTVNPFGMSPMHRRIMRTAG